MNYVKISFVLLLASVSHQLSAQDFLKDSVWQRIRLSVSAGLTVSDFAMAKSAADYRFGNTLGVFLGVQAEYPIRNSTKLNWLGGLQYSYKGAELKPKEVILYDRIDYTLSYVELVVGASYYPSQRFRIHGALLPAVKLSEEINYSALSGWVSGSSETKDFRSFDAGAQLGFSFTPRVWKDNLSAGISYTYGLLPIEQKSADISKVRNRCLNLYVTYTL